MTDSEPSTLSPGAKLSFYEILGPIGAGGMGEVYRAQDTRLEREVAIKVLPVELAQDEERLKRFEREAKTLASLNHPNVAGIYGVDQVEDVCFLALELVPGEDLAARLAGGPLPIDEAIDIGRQIAAGLEAAHEAGVVHRDLKPANVRVTPQGVVKILDFGLAKPIHPKASKEGTTTAESDSFLATEEGLVLGTPTYMSPEQARGRAVDRRTDLWAFGCVLYECFAGRRAFAGDSFTDVVAAIVAGQPDWSLLPALPPRVRELLPRCFAKDPLMRLRDAGEARVQLQLALTETEEPASNARVASRRSFGLLGALGLAVGAFLGGQRFAPGSDDGPSMLLESLTFSAVTDLEGDETFPTLAPDGKRLAFAAEVDGRWDIYAQRIGGSRVQNLTEDLDGAHQTPSFSPDGERIAFANTGAGGGIFVMGATGESPRRVTDFGVSPSWSPDGTEIAFATELTLFPSSRFGISELYVADALSGDVRKIETPDAVDPAWSPDGAWIAYWGLDQGGNRNIYVIPAEGGEPRLLVQSPATDWGPAWSPVGEEIFFGSDRGGVMNLWRAAFDAATGETRGEPQPVTNGVAASLGRASFSGDGSRFAFTAHKQEVYVVRLRLDVERMEVQGLPDRVPGTRGSSAVTISPDGQWLAYMQRNAQEDLFVVGVDGRQRRQLTNDPHRDRSPIWSPDGKRVYSFSDRSGTYQIWSHAPDGSDPIQHTDGDKEFVNPAPSADGKRLFVYAVRENRAYLIDEDPTSTAPPTPFAPIPKDGAQIIMATAGPDGRWLVIGREGQRDLVHGIASADGSSCELIPMEEPGPIFWGPAGKGLLSLSTTEPALQYLDPADGEARTLYDFGSLEPGAVSLSPDGEWIYVSISESGTDIWLADRRTRQEESQ